jgi:hypothetical protein
MLFVLLMDKGKNQEYINKEENSQGGMTHLFLLLPIVQV